MLVMLVVFFFFFFNDTATTEIYTLSLHDALPIYRQFPSKGAFLLSLFEQYAAVARAGPGARQASWFLPLTIQFAAQAMRDPLLRRRFAIVLAEASEGGTPEGDLLKALARVLRPVQVPLTPSP